MSSSQTMERSQPDGSDDRFVYFAEIPSLQEIASFQVALAIRYNDHLHHFFNPNYFFYSGSNEHRNYDLQIETLRKPSVVKEMIKNCVAKIEEELSAWLNHFNHILYGLSRHRFKVNPVDINWCVWLPTGEIDYFKTGLKMLRSEKLDQRQKFLIMCEYCMEDEIKKVSLDTLPDDYVEDTYAQNYHDDGILLYWLRFLKNTLHETSGGDYASPEAAIARNFQYYARFAVEYFWHRIGIEDQFTVVSEWIARRCDTHFECAAIERLISAMSWPQQQCLLALKSVQMLINFSLYSRSTRCALWVWEYTKREIPEEQFARIIVDIMLRRWTCERHPCPALIEIWETADDHQRQFVIQTKSNSIIDMCLFKYNNPGNALEFVIKFLREIPLEERKRIMFDQDTKIRRHSFDLSVFNKILEVCLPNPKEKLAFINSVIDSDGMMVHFYNFLLDREFEKLNDVLEFYYGQDIERARTFKKNLLESVKFQFRENRTMIFITSVEDWSKLGKYIDEIFSNDPVQALKEKQRFIRYLIGSHQYRYTLSFHRDIQDTIKIIEVVFATDEELKNIKRAFASSFGESLKTRNYWQSEEVSDETYFQRVVEWCLGNDEEAIMEFKTRVSQDTIFKRFFFRINKMYKEFSTNADYLEGLLERLDKYLIWYLETDDQVKKFKVEKLNASFKELKIFQSILRKKDGHFLNILLKWFFDGDDVQVQMFRWENFQF